MRFIAFPIVPVLFGIILGIVAEHFYSFTINAIYVCLFLSAAGFAFAYYLNQIKKLQSYLFESCVLALSFSFGLFSTYANYELHDKNHFSHSLFERNIVQGVFVEQLKSTAYYHKFILKTTAINSQKSSGHILFYVPKKRQQKMEVGNRIKAFVSPKLLQNSYNPYQFNYTKYLQNLNVFYEVKLQDKDEIFVTIDTNWYYVTHFIKSKLLDSYSIKSFTSDNYHLLMALLFGEKTEVSKELKTAYTQAGIIHILAISGLHISLIYAIVLWFSKPLLKLKRGKLYVFLLSLSILWFYAILAGFSASIVRAVVMFSVLAFAKLMNRHSNVFNSLAISAFILLLYNPNYLFDVGFQLSFAAVISIVVFQPLVQKYSCSEYYLVRETKALLLISIVAQLGVLPLTLYYFGQFPFLFLIANLVAIPLSSLILVLGLVVLPFNFLWSKLAFYLSVCINTLIDWMNLFTIWIVQFENLILKDIAFHEVLVLLMYAVIAAIVYLVYNPRIRNISFVLVSILFFQLGYLYHDSKESINQEFVVFQVMKHNLFVETRNNCSLFYTDDFQKAKPTIEAYARGKFVKNYRVVPLKNIFSFEKKILCVDRFGVYATKQKPEIVVLTQSPDINLKRMISMLKPTQIIADGSNYKSDIKLWKQTCEEEKIPFHATAEKGFYRLK